MSRALVCRSILALAAVLVAFPAPAATPGRQATYDAAQAAFEAEDWNGAMTGFASLLPADHRHALSRSEAVIAARLASAYLHVGRYADARATAQRAIAALPDGDTAERIDALTTAASAARYAYDYPAAIRDYGRAAALAQKALPPALIDIRIGKALAEVTVDPVAAGHDLDATLSDKAAVDGMDRKRLAIVEDLRARAAINAGDSAAALQWVDRAIRHSGGLTTDKVETTQVAIRNDAAIVTSLRHDDDATRRYLAYTGAGHSADTHWIGSYQGDLPVCSDTADIRPDDSVVVQFAIADDGHVRGALPVYASRPGTLGETFARTVSDWHWNADAVRSVNGFWRSTLVLQLRCQSRPTPDRLDLPLRDAAAAWLTGRGIDSAPDAIGGPGPTDAALAVPDGLKGVPALMTQPALDTVGTMERLQQLFDANGAPPDAYALLIAYASRHPKPMTVKEAAHILADQRSRHDAASPLRFAANERAKVLGGSVPPFVARFPGTLAAAYLQLELALALEDGGDFGHARPLLETVLATPATALGEDAPIRQVAVLHHAIVLRQLGLPDTPTGSPTPSLEQCSLFDTHPVPESVAISSAQFPMEALRWAFEGYVREAYDITDDGHVANARTVVAYPPFIFAPSSEKAVRGFRYVPPKVDGHSVGCTGQVQGIAYRLPFITDKKSH